MTKSQADELARRNETEVKIFVEELEKSTDWFKSQPFGKAFNLFDEVVSGKYRKDKENATKRDDKKPRDLIGTNFIDRD